MTPDKILIVEDEFITAMALQESLKRLAYEVAGTPVSTGEEAVLAAMRLQPDLILMDIQLDGPMDGVIATQRIQPLLNVPVVYVTAYTDPETLKRVIYTVPYGFVSKPFTDDELKEAIEKALARHRAKKGQ